MFEFGSLNKNLNKLLLTLRDFKKTAYHHYGESPFSFLRFLYYSGVRINTFFVYENDLLRELPEHNLESDYRVVKPTLEELVRMRDGRANILTDGVALSSEKFG